MQGVCFWALVAKAHGAFVSRCIVCLAIGIGYGGQSIRCTKHVIESSHKHKYKHSKTFSFQLCKNGDEQVCN